MYSVVLMAALTTGGEAPDWVFGHCHSCAPSNCYGGYAAWGCTGWGCYGYGNGGWYGGGCFGTACGGGFGCYGGYWNMSGSGGPALDYNCFGCHGCYGCAGSYGCTGYLPSGPAPEQIGPPRVEEKKPGGMGMAPIDRAKVIVQLPPEAKLYVDDQPVKTTADKQAFSTPRLDRGQTYYYEVRAEVVRDGKTVVESKRILVRAGEEVSVTFPKLDSKAVDVAATAPPPRR